jgi:hypothetical protein
MKFKPNNQVKLFADVKAHSYAHMSTYIIPCCTTVTIIKVLEAKQQYVISYYIDDVEYRASIEPSILNK